MEEEAREGVTHAITTYGRPLAIVPSFRYLGRALTAIYNDCTLVVENLINVCLQWE